MIDMLYDKFKPWAETGNIWLYSDTHFDDPDCKFMATDWPSPQEQIDIINKDVHKTDTFVLLGDVGNPEYIKKIKAGRKILIAGNHDKGLTNYQKKIITRVYDADEWGRNSEGERKLRKTLREEFPTEDISISMSYESHSPLVRYNVTIKDRMFDEVYGGPLFIADRILLSHEPIGLPFSYNLHGHTHGLPGGAYRKRCYDSCSDNNYDEYHYNLCSNTIGYKPVNLKEIIRTIGLKNIPNIHRITIDKATKNSIDENSSCEL